MNIRQEVEKALLAFAAAQTPPLAVALEAKSFTKPDGPWIEIVFLDPEPMNPTVDGTRTRVYGVFQINVYVLDGKGMKQLDALTKALVDLFPMHQKELYTTFSVEQTPSVSRSFPDDKFRCAAVRVKYRQEFVSA